jgi:hypothetical protein
MIDMKFPTLNINDKVIGKWGECYYPFTVTQVTPARFTVANGTKFLRSNGRVWGECTGTTVDRAVPYTEELWNKALEQAEKRNAQRKRERLINTLYCKMDDIRKHHLNRHSTDKLNRALLMVEDLLREPFESPKQAEESKDQSENQSEDQTSAEEAQPTQEEIEQKLSYEDSFTS